MSLLSRASALVDLPEPAARRLEGGQDATESAVEDRPSTVGADSDRLEESAGQDGAILRTFLKGHHGWDADLTKGSGHRSTPDADFGPAIRWS